MKVVHFECGLGNQMTCFANYLLVKENNPDEDVLIEDLVYRIDREGLGYNQWNGFELGDIFGLKFDNILDAAPDPDALLRNMNEQYRIDKGADNSRSAYTALSKSGITLDLAGDFQHKTTFSDYLTGSSSNVISYSFKKLAYGAMRKLRKHDTSMFGHREGDCFYPLSFNVMKNGKALEAIDGKLRSALTFPEIPEGKNMEISKLIADCESVSIHARRSDFLQYNNDCYRYGFFRKAADHIRKNVKAPVFFVFSEDSAWCRDNSEILGLTEDDRVYHVDWNQGTESYRDMQLMSMCRHNIITRSSFGWWASYLNPNPGKIVIAQASEYCSKVYY